MIALITKRILGNIYTIVSYFFLVQKPSKKVEIYYFSFHKFFIFNFYNVIDKEETIRRKIYNYFIAPYWKGFSICTFILFVPYIGGGGGIFITKKKKIFLIQISFD